MLEVPRFSDHIGKSFYPFLHILLLQRSQIECCTAGQERGKGNTNRCHGEGEPELCDAFLRTPRFGGGLFFSFPRIIVRTRSQEDLVAQRSVMFHAPSTISLRHSPGRLTSSSVSSSHSCLAKVCSGSNALPCLNSFWKPGLEAR